VKANVFPQYLMAVLMLSAVMSTKLLSPVGLANIRYNVTLMYAGIKSSVPSRKIAKCERGPLGGLDGVHDQDCRYLAPTHPILGYI